MERMSFRSHHFCFRSHSGLVVWVKVVLRGGSWIYLDVLSHVNVILVVRMPVLIGTGTG